MNEAKPDYGLDAPGLVKLFIAGGSVLLFLRISLHFSIIPAFSRNFVSQLPSGIIFILTGGLMVWSSYFGKYRARDRLMDSLHLKGSETLLDLGCGRGLLLISGAKRLPQGKSIGIDLWSQADLSSNSKEATLKNAEIENVQTRIEIIEGNMCKLPLADSSVDVVVASMSIHNIPTKELRELAIHETVRVLKPGGKIALLDFRCTREYMKSAERFGLKNVRRTGLSFLNFPPSRTVSGEKAAH